PLSLSVGGRRLGSCALNLELDIVVRSRRCPTAAWSPLLRLSHVSGCSTNGVKEEASCVAWSQRKPIFSTRHQSDGWPRGLRKRCVIAAERQEREAREKRDRGRVELCEQGPRRAS